MKTVHVHEQDPLVVARAYASNAAQHVAAAESANIILHGSDPEYFQFLAMRRRSEHLTDTFLDLKKEEEALG